jgi:DNA mismatch endonuclease, patch repair protein
MVDSVDRATRSKVMSAIRSKGNQSTEMAMVELLRFHKVSGWRRHHTIEGKPDFVWLKLRVALFVDGCFWHGCPCRRAPKSNTDFWDKKILYNRQRDLKVSRSLRKLGWKVIRIKECKLNHSRSIARIKRTIAAALMREKSCDT